MRQSKKLAIALTFVILVAHRYRFHLTSRRERVKFAGLLYALDASL